jgi:hypothetical protein
MVALQENHTYDLVKLPKGNRILKNRWIYRLKTQEHSSQPKYEVRMVLKGQSEEICRF